MSTSQERNPIRKRGLKADWMKHYEDLIQRLRTATKLPLLQALMNEAADAIEALVGAEKRKTGKDAPLTDYISREALLERIDGIWDCADMTFEPNDKCCRTDDCASCKWRETKNAIRKIAANIPAADVRPVVLCRDCDCWNDWDSAGRESLGNYVCSCAYWSVEDGPVFYTRPTDFCSNGEKREES